MSRKIYLRQWVATAVLLSSTVGLHKTVPARRPAMGGAVTIKEECPQATRKRVEMLAQALPLPVCQSAMEQGGSPRLTTLSCSPRRSFAPVERMGSTQDPSFQPPDADTTSSLRVAADAEWNNVGVLGEPLIGRVPRFKRYASRRDPTQEQDSIWPRGKSIRQGRALGRRGRSRGQRLNPLRRMCGPVAVMFRHTRAAVPTKYLASRPGMHAIRQAQGRL